MKKKLNFAFSFYICYVVVDYFIGKEFFVVLFFFNFNHQLCHRSRLRSTSNLLLLSNQIQDIIF